MRIVFMGTPDFSVPTLKALVEAGHEVAAVVTQPDKPRGRGNEIQMTPVKLQAMEYNIPVHQPLKVREASFVQVLRELGADVFVVIAFGQILSREVLDIPRLGCVNIHASLLPEYRGAAPIQWCVIRGEKESGITTMMMDAGIDTGDMLERLAVPLEEKETGGSLHDKLSKAGSELILSTLKKLEEGTITRTPQTKEDAFYAKMLTKSIGEIDWDMDAISIERLIRGLNPWPSAYTSWKGKTVKIWAGDVLPHEWEENMARSHPHLGTLPPGSVLCADRHSLVVKTGHGCLSVKELQIEGKKRMDIESFLRGYPVAKGDILKKKT